MQRWNCGRHRPKSRNSHLGVVAVCTQWVVLLHFWKVSKHHPPLQKKGETRLQLQLVFFAWGPSTFIWPPKTPWQNRNVGTLTSDICGSCKDAWFCGKKKCQESRKKLLKVILGVLDKKKVMLGVFDRLLRFINRNVEATNITRVTRESERFPFQWKMPLILRTSCYPCHQVTASEVDPGTNNLMSCKDCFLAKIGGWKVKNLWVGHSVSKCQEIRIFGFPSEGEMFFQIFHVDMPNPNKDLQETMTFRDKILIWYIILMMDQFPI